MFQTMTVVFTNKVILYNEYDSLGFDIQITTLMRTAGEKVSYTENFTPSSSAEVPLKIASFPLCSSSFNARISTVRSIP